MKAEAPSATRDWTRRSGDERLGAQHGFLRNESLYFHFYRRLGHRYPIAIVAALLQSGMIVAAGAVGLLSFYIEMSLGEFVTFLALTLAVSAVAVAVGIARASRMLGPVKDWIRGERDPRSSRDAWQAAVSLPERLVLGGWRLHPFPSLAIVLGIGAVAVVGVSWIGALAIVVGACVAFAYSGVLAFFYLESGLRPVMADIERTLSLGLSFDHATFSLKWRLLAALPLISVITGVVVAGITSPEENFRELGFDVLLALGVAFAVSSMLSLRLSSSLLRGVNELTDAATRVERGDFSRYVPVTTSDEVGRLARVFNRTMVGLAERERARHALGTYLDPDVAERVLGEGPWLAGEEIDVTILFADVRDFTSLAQGTEPDRVVALLNRLFELIVPIVERHAGYVDKFTGDGLLAVFGALEQRHEHADEALAAALEIDGGVRHQFGEELRVAMGLNSGPVVAGNIGGGGRLNFSVIGDTVNLASRVEGATPETGDTILVTEHVKKLLKDADVGLQRRPAIALKGVDATLDLFAPCRDAEPQHHERARD